jgi:uncharacterized protein (DUF2267 family)
MAFDPTFVNLQQRNRKTTKKVSRSSPRKTPLAHGETRKHPLNFENFAAEGNRFINEIAYELNTDRNHAARVLRAVLHAVRDRLPADDAIQFAQGLPLALKGVFIDQYDLSDVPVVIRSPQKFLQFIYSKAGITAHLDFPDRQSIVDALQAVFFVLENHMDYGQILQVKHIMNQEIVELIDAYEEM